MEIEAKFRVPDEETFERLEEAVALGGFAVSPGRLVDLDDRYLDTGDYRVLSAGYFCRRRASQDGIVMTFKGVGGGDGAIHRREEVSVELEADGPPSAWPDGPARDLAVRLTGDRTVAELALDRVTIDTRRGGMSFLECEIELRPGGTERDLEELVAAVQQRWHLESVSDSKFARGLALATGVPLGRTEDWQRELRRLRVQRWVQQTRAQTRDAGVGPSGAGDLPARQRSEAAVTEVQATQAQTPRPPAPEATPTVTVQPDIDRGDQTETGAGMRALFARDMPEAEVGGRMRELFEPTGPEAEVSEQAHVQSEAGEPGGLEEPVATEEPEPEVAEPEEPEAEVAEPEEPEPEVLEEPMAAEGPKSDVAEPEVAGPELAEVESAEEVAPALEVAGPEVEEPAASVEEPEVVEPEAAAEGETAAAQKKERARPGIVSDDTMDEAARKTLLFHFERMLKHEPGTREGEDAEELHDMRVATRRMRAALRVFDGYVDRAAVKPYLKALRRTGRTLGTVRDLDVFHEKTMRYLGGLPEGHESDLDPLLGAWRTERDGARAVMIDYLDSQPHKRFARRFGEFLETPGAAAVEPFDADGEPLPRLVRDVLPVVLFERLAAVRAFAEWLDEPDVPLTRYHRLRIASKGLRYTLEFFEEVLGPGSRPLIEDVKTLQDHLGDLQDAVVGCGVAGSFLTWGTWQAPGKRCCGPAHPVLNAPGVATYLAHRQQEIATLIEAFPPVWERVSGPDFARGVSELVAGI